MIKIIFSFLFSMSMLAASSFQFNEQRYSDAISKYINVDGEISFLKDGLEVFYPKNSVTLHYENNTLTYTREDKEKPIPQEQAQQIMQYFDILLLIHKNDDEAYKKVFKLQVKDNLTLLEPLGSIKDYISSIEISKKANLIKKVKIFLRNNDNITITINDEI